MDTVVSEKRPWAAPNVVGTCASMCPPGEVQERLHFKQLHVSHSPEPTAHKRCPVAIQMLERNPRDPRDTSLMVKKYYRTVTETTKQPEYLRDRDGIARSMDRLRALMDRDDVPFETRASFIWDRYRAIWKDMSIQDWTDMFRVTVLEEIVRFLILADFEISRQEQGDSLNYQDSYDTEFGIQLMLQCFVTLSDLYEVMRAEGRSCPNEFEFRIYHALLQMAPVEGRRMEHEEIERVFRLFPDELAQANADRLQMLHALYSAMKRQKLDVIVNMTWQMDFFEYALGRRIVERFREFKFIQFFKHLKQTDLMRSHPRMALHEFCDRFFLDSVSGSRYAKACGMKVVTESDGQTFVTINEGYVRPKKRTIPPIGLGIPLWGFMTGEVKISDFVIQRPIKTDYPFHNFTRCQLVWPSYDQALDEWRALRMTYGISEHIAIIGHLLYWQKLNRLEVLHEFPEVAMCDKDGNVVLPHDHLPFFRPVVIYPYGQIPQESLEAQQDPVQSATQQEISLDVNQGNQAAAHGSSEQPTQRVVESDGKEEGEITPDTESPNAPKEHSDSAASGHTTRALSAEAPATPEESAAAVVSTEIHSDADRATGHQPTASTGTTSVHVTQEIRECPCNTSGEIQPEPAIQGSAESGDVGAAQSSGREQPLALASGKRPISAIGSGYTHHQTLSCSALGLPRKKRLVSHVAIQCNRDEEDKPECLPFLTPPQEERILPPDAEERWVAYREKYIGDRGSVSTLLMVENQFYEDYIYRSNEMKQFEKTVPLGWEADPKQRDRLLDVSVPWKEPEIVPKYFPPQLTKRHLLDLVKDHPSVNKPIMALEMAQRIGSQAPKERRCVNCVWLSSGPPDEKEYPQKWLMHRFFGESGKREVNETVWYDQVKGEYLNLTVQQCNLHDLSEDDTKHIQNASVIFLLLENTLQLTKICQGIKELRHLFESKLPAFVFLNAIDSHECPVPRESRILFLEEQENNNAEVESQIKGCLDISQMDVAIIPLARHLDAVTSSMHLFLSDRWRKHFGSLAERNKKFIIDPSTEAERQYDPLEHAFESIWRLLDVKDLSNATAAELFVTDEEVEEKLRDWNREWKEIKAHADIWGLERPDQLSESVRWRQDVLKRAIAEKEASKASQPLPKRVRTVRKRKASPRSPRSRSPGRRRNQ